jgi:hypothetical protein
MTRVLIVNALLIAFAAGAVGADEPEPIRLFNGKDLDGWTHAGPGSFDLKDGELRTVGGMGLLWYSRRTFADYTLRLEFKTTRLADNSGVFVRFSDPQGDPWKAVKEGEEVQIQDGAKRLHTGGIYPVKNASELASNPPGQWNSMEVTLTGSTINVKINGKHVTEYTSPKPQPPDGGYVGLQNHDPDSHVTFRNVTLVEHDAPKP